MMEIIGMRIEIIANKDKDKIKNKDKDNKGRWDLEVKIRNFSVWVVTHAKRWVFGVHGT